MKTTKTKSLEEQLLLAISKKKTTDTICEIVRVIGKVKRGCDVCPFLLTNAHKIGHPVCKIVGMKDKNVVKEAKERLEVYKKLDYLEKL